MKPQNLILGLVVFFFVTCSLVFAQTFETIQIGNGTQKFSKPVWSPNGEKLAFWGPGGIYVCKWDGSEQPRKIFNTFGEDLMWASDSELVYWQRKVTKIKEEGKRPKRVERESIRLVSLNGTEKVIKEAKSLSVLVQLHDGTIGFYEGDALSGNPLNIVKKGKTGTTDLSKLMKVETHFPTVYDLATRKPKYDDTDIWIASLDGSFKKRVTFGKSYYFPQLSPDGTKILAKKPNFGLVVLNLNGDETEIASGSGEVVSPGVFKGIIGSTAQWSSNDSLIVYVETRETGEEVLGSELFVTTADGMEKRQLTDIPDETETDPIWSPDGNKIAYWTENSGKIYVTKIK